MPKEQIKQAAVEARKLAEQLADIVRQSNIPLSHVDEVIEQLKDLLGQQDDPEQHDE